MPPRRRLLFIEPLISMRAILETRMRSLARLYGRLRMIRTYILVQISLFLSVVHYVAYLIWRGYIILA